MRIRKLLAIGLVFACATPFAAAQAYNLDLFYIQAYQQTGVSTSSLQGYYSAERIDSFGTAADPTSATVTRPSGTIDTLSQIDPTQLQYQTGLYSSLASFQSDFPTGTYSFSGNGGVYTGSVENSGSLWATNPTLVSNYAALTGGLMPGQAFTVNFAPFTPAANSNSATTYISLYNLTTNAYVDGAAYSPSATSWTIAAGDLLANDQYQLVIDDDNRILGPAQPLFQGAGTILSYDTNQSVYFATTPEPGPFVVVGMGVLGLLLRRRRK